MDIMYKKPKDYFKDFMVAVDYVSVAAQYILKKIYGHDDIKYITVNAVKALRDTLDAQPLEANHLLMHKDVFDALRAWEDPIAEAAKIILEKVYGHKG